MEKILQESLWLQFGASTDSLKNAIEFCPDEQWEANDFWYRVYHTLFWNLILRKED